MNHAEKVAKIRVLAERGATEGERAAARAALERLGEPLEAPPVDRSRGFEFQFKTPSPDPRVQEFIDDILRTFEEQYRTQTGRADEDYGDWLDKLFGSHYTAAQARARGHHESRKHEPPPRTPRGRERIHYDPND